MFENLTNKFEEIFSSLKKAPSLDEKQVDEGLKGIRQALLEADVSLDVAKDFIEKVKPKALGQEIIRSTSPGEMVVKIVYDELVSLLGEKNSVIAIRPQQKLTSFKPIDEIQFNKEFHIELNENEKKGKQIQLYTSAEALTSDYNSRKPISIMQLNNGKYMAALKNQKYIGVICGAYSGKFVELITIAGS